MQKIELVGNEAERCRKLCSKGFDFSSAMWVLSRIFAANDGMFFVTHVFLAKNAILSPWLRAWSACKMPELHLLEDFLLFLCRASALSGDSWKGCEQKFKKHLRNIVGLKVLCERNIIQNGNELFDELGH